ncbi:MAG: hypothetical protein WC831_05190 [Parcubacteria group bacterium]|jgi:hypothetical protein
MKVNVNILPDEQKEKKEIEKKIGKIGRFGFSIVFVFIIFLAILFSAKFVLEIDYKSVQETFRGGSEKSNSDIKQTEDFLSDINSTAKKINKMSSETPRWSKVLKKISEISSPDLRITLIHAEGVHVIIGGFSKTREAFLDFQEKLEKEGYKKINSPISNLVSPKDFNFEIEMDIDAEYLNRD